MTPEQNRALAKVVRDSDQSLAAAREFLIDLWAAGQGRQAMETFDLSIEMASSDDPMVRQLGRFAGLGLMLSLQQALPVVWGGPHHVE
jgi:hypothetical protein